MRLIVEQDGKRSEVALEGPSLSIGRAPDNQLQISDPKVSRYHCRVEPAEGGCWVVDLGSANGLLANGERTRRVFLRPGDELALGGARLTVDPGPEGEALEFGTLVDAEAELEQPWRGLRAALAALRTEDPARAAAGFLDQAIEVLGAERGFLLTEPGRLTFLGGDFSSGEFPGGDSAERRCLAARQFDHSDIPLPEGRLSAEMSKSLFEGGQPVLSVDASRDPRFKASTSVQELKLRALVGVPVLLGGRAVAALVLDNRLQAAAFEGPALAQLGLFAELLAQDFARREAECAHSRADQRLAERGFEELPVTELPATPRRAGRDYAPLTGRSAAMRAIFEQLDRIVENDLPVLIHGESGTGKELVARAIHKHGLRARAPFVSENCAALPDSLLESELFGHSRGAFTGADRAKKGLIAQANGGTLFLDEIGDMSAEMQKKLLRVLQEGELRPVGSDQVEKVDVRLLAASHRDLEKLVASGEFRQDLYYRINVLSVRLPPLRERPEDVPLLCRALLGRIAKELDRAVPSLPHEVLVALSEYRWPGNVRELENELRRLLVVADGRVRLSDLSPQILEKVERAHADDELFGEVAGDLRSRVAQFEHRSILAALEKHGGNKSRAAAELGLSRFALQRKLDKYAAGEVTAGHDQGSEEASGD